MKNLFIVFLALLILASCKDKEKPPIPVSKITMEANPATVVTGSKLKLTPTVEPGDAANKTLTWESSAPTIATVDSNGEVTGVAAGTATITATAADGSKVTGTLALTVKSNDASVSTIILGVEKFTVPMPADGATTITLNNVPRTLSSTIKEVAVNITTAAGATIRIGTEDFKQGQVFDFTGSKEFKVTAEDGTTVKTYTLAIAAYHSISNPYGIYTAAHLNDVRNDKAGNYKLMNNLTLPALNEAGAAATTGIEDYPEKGWLPIAHDAAVTFIHGDQRLESATGEFTGTFDGRNFSINNLCINRSVDFAGLFGVTSGATLKDLNITGTTSPSAVTSRYAGTLAGLNIQSSVINCQAVNFSISLTANSPYSYAGGLVGRNEEGVISNCYATGSVSVSSTSTAYAGGLVGRSNTGRISNCHTAGSVSASSSSTSGYKSYYVGGLVGYSFNNKISNCYAMGSVSAIANSSSAGGLVGVSGWRSSLSNCYAMGSVSDSYIAGGLVGTNQGKITNCYATGNVSSSSFESIAGGLVGSGDSNAEISNCYATGSVFSSLTAGGLVGSSHGLTISNCYATGSVSASYIVGGLVGRGYGGTISNCYATGSVSASSTNSNSYAGGLLGKKGDYAGVAATFNNCYRNSEAEIKKNNASSEPADASFTGITAKSKRDMQTDAFTTSLNEGVSVWGRSSGKNDDLPYIKGVGIGKN